MEKQMTAERNRRALVLPAEGERQAAITRAESFSCPSKLLASWEAPAREMLARIEGKT